MAETKKKKKKSKKLTETFTVRTLKKGFDQLGGIANKIRGENRGTRGIDQARRAKNK